MPLNLPLLDAQLQYPAMTWVESQIARAWLHVRWGEWNKIDFNVRLGEGQAPPEDADESTRRMVRAITTLRADFIVQRDDSVAIVEVKVRVSGAAIGQLQVYRHHWLAGTGDPRPVRMIAIGRSAIAGIEAAAAAAGVEVELFPRSPSQLEAPGAIQP